MISHILFVHCVLTLNKYQSINLKVIPIDSCGVVSTIVSHIIFLCIHQIILFVKKTCAINIFWFFFFYGNKPFQLSDIKDHTPYLFITSWYPCIYELSILPDSFLTMRFSLYIYYIKIYLFISCFPSLYFLPRTPYMSFLSISGLLIVCPLMPFLFYFYLDNHFGSMLGELPISNPFRRFRHKYYVTRRILGPTQC